MTEQEPCDTNEMDILLSLPPTDSIEDMAAILQGLKLDNGSNSVELLRERRCIGDDVAASNTGFTQRLLTKVQEHLSTRYAARPEITARCSIVPANSNDCTIRTYVETNNTTNATAGYWSSTWTVQVVDERTARLASGRIEVHSWCGEDGANVQTQVRYDVPEETITTKEEVVHSKVAQWEQETMSYEEQLVEAVFKCIVQMQDDIVYPAVTSMDTDAALRKLRRVLPITKTRFKWDSAAQRNVKLLNERTANNI